METGRIRLRPILMTALTTILGMSTMALATGMGAEMMQPMAVVIVGGAMFGVLGMLLGVPLAAAVYKLVREDVKKGESEQDAMAK